VLLLDDSQSKQPEKERNRKAGSTSNTERLTKGEKEDEHIEPQDKIERERDLSRSQLDVYLFL
jgi:hypothetical protein